MGKSRISQKLAKSISRKAELSRDNFPFRSPYYLQLQRSFSIMNNNGLATTAGGALIAAKLATATGATATGIATTTGGVGITTVATATGTAMSVAIAPAVAIAAPVIAVGALIWWLARD
jgi:hypothetical protein